MFFDPLFKPVINLVLAAVLFGPGTIGYPQTADAYERKSVSSIDMVWLASPSARSLKPKQADLLLSAIRRQIMGEEGLGARFDYNSLKKESALVGRFIRKASEEDDLTMERAAELLTETLAEPIVRILDAQKEIRAKARVSEAERRKFITIKAKELGITAEDFEKVMNSAYLYLPVLTRYSREVTKTTEEKENEEEKEKGKGKKTSIRYKLTGGIVWFKLDVSPAGKGSVRLLTQLETHSSYSADLKGIYKLQENANEDIPVPGAGIFKLIKKTVTAVSAPSMDEDSYAFLKASQSLAKNLAIKTAELEEFCLSAQVFDYAGGMVGFNLGKREGVFLDQKFRVYEKVEDEAGTLELEKKGFFMARGIGDNTTNPEVLSRGKRIIGEYEPGMMVKEFPRIGIDVAIRPGAASLTIPKGTCSGGFGDSLCVEKEIQTLFSILDLAAQTNTARFLGVPQTFITLGGFLGAIPAKDVKISYAGEQKDAYAGVCWGLYGGLIKKHYFRRVAFFAEARYEVQAFSFSRSFDDDDLTYTNTIELLSGAAGMEIALRADLNIGFTGGFKGFGGAIQDTWESEKKEENEEEGEKKAFTGPEVDYSGPFFGIQLIYSPPTW